MQKLDDKIVKKIHINLIKKLLDLMIFGNPWPVDERTTSTTAFRIRSLKVVIYLICVKFKLAYNSQKSPSQAGQLDRAVKDTVNNVAGGRLAVQFGSQNFGLPR
ncbi:hypothetical protein BpHYR1_013440 [Brachionus plicatilis]|uniref:Uncharacterized protein n=1 Tax=Brachionus plicatilis TaxID=10195 RepID=A0A3M7SG32_BRAPC|nr:hypothetical protein BpHYR1_013440 [Brachionus plicatilis]